MLTPQFLLPIHRELVIDLFAGGGGASTGIEEAIGRPVDIAINHNLEAVAMHLANHPQTKHYVSDVFEVDPLEVVDGLPVGMLWASPDCKHFSKAKGGKPVSKKIRGLAWVVVKWAKLVRPRIIFLENVEEFQTWGPLDANNMPCPRRKGRTFARWKKSLENLGYTVHHQEDRACDLGTPTIRKRLFLVARRDGHPIVVPQYTHAAPGSLLVKSRKAKPYRTAAECIMWDQPAPSIFERTRELADATKRRIAKGIMRYVVNADTPFIVPLTHQGGDRVEGLDEPFKTITGANRGEKALIVPTFARQEEVASFLAEHANVVSASLIKNYTGVVGSDMADPMGTVTSVDHHSLLTANLVGVGARAGQSRPRGMDEPVATITAKYDTALMTSNLIKLRGTSKEAQSVEEPLHTISAGGTHHAEVRAFLLKYYGTDQDPKLDEPLHTVTTKDRFGLVTVKGEPYAIVDIGLRMLKPRELYRAQGFKDSYVIDWGVHPHTGEKIKLTSTAAIRMCGNSVCPPMARAYVAANYREEAVVQEAKAA